jgi:HEAT repeat protein
MLRALGETGGPSAVEHIGPFVSYKSTMMEPSSVRASAIKTLRNIGDPRAFEHIVQASWFSDALAERIASTFPGISSQSERTEVAETQRESFAELRTCAAEALGKLGLREAIEPLREALKDDHCQVRKAAQLAITEIEYHSRNKTRSE